MFKHRVLIGASIVGLWLAACGDDESSIGSGSDGGKTIGDAGAVTTGDASTGTADGGALDDARVADASTVAPSVGDAAPDAATSDVITLDAAVVDASGERDVHATADAEADAASHSETPDEPLLLGDAGAGAGSCTLPSCIVDLFTGCVPDLQDECTMYGWGETLCWPSGGYQTMQAGPSGITADIFEANGDVCLSIASYRNFEDGTFDLEWKDAQGEVAAIGLQRLDGSYTIQCAGEEAVEIPAGADCAPFDLPFLSYVPCVDAGDDLPSAGTCGY